jgi:hypothetical protein
MLSSFSLAAAQADIIFSMFETDTNGFTVTGSLTGLSRVRLPTSTNTSMWLAILLRAQPLNGMFGGPV